MSPGPAQGDPAVGTPPGQRVACADPAHAAARVFLEKGYGINYPWRQEQRCPSPART